MLVPEQPDILASIARATSDMGGNIVSLIAFPGEDPTKRLITVKVAGVREGELVAGMKLLGLEIVDARTCVGWLRYN